jgi:hypothetical protein
MAKLEKSALSQYLRTRCDRFLYLSLFQTRGFEHTPFPLPGRPGIAAYRARGLEFERQKMAELHSLFGGRCRHIAEAAKRNRKHAPEDLFALQLRAAPSPPQYWLEPELKARSFTETLLHRLRITSQPYPDVSNLRPDVVELLDAETLGPQGVIHILDASGTISEWDPTDGRQLLRVMDMKVSEHLNTSYAAEVVLYSMVLAAWLEQRGLADRFVVLAAPAVWVRGLYKSLTLPKATDPLAERLEWVNQQVERADAHLYAPPVLKFLVEDVPRVMAAANWRQDLDWGVSPTCGQCDWLGFPAWSKRALDKARDQANQLGWAHQPSLDDYCYAETTQGQLATQIPQLTTGMRRTLTEAKIITLSDLAGRHPEDIAFQQHHGLRIQAPRLPRKAQAILAGQAHMRPDFRTAQMANFAHLRLTVNVSFDAATGMLIALGLGIDYSEPRPRDLGNAARRDGVARKQVISYFIDKQDPEVELEQLLDFLRTISSTLDWIRRPDTYREFGEGSPQARARYAWDHATVQVCFWDERQAQALRDAIGRHLHHLIGHDVLRAAIWLFPPEEVVGSDRTADTPPVCYLQQVTTALAILPTTINDDLISVAESLIRFEAKLSDFQWDRIGGAIPKERALEIWQQMPPKNPPMSLSQCRRQYERIMETLVHATRQLVFFLTAQHKQALRAKAPLVKELEPTQFQHVAPDTLLWLAHLGFEEGSQRLEQRIAMTMDPHELEARFAALRTTGSLPTAEASAYLQACGLGQHAERYVFQVRRASQHVKFRNEESFLVLLPEDPPGAGLMPVATYVSAVGAPAPDYTRPYWRGMEYTPMKTLMGAQLVRFDRERLLAVIDLPPWGSHNRRRRDLMACGALDFNQPLMLVEGERILTFPQVKDVATRIGNPSNAIPAPETAGALVKLNRRPGHTRPSRVARLLWEPHRLVDAQTPIDTETCNAVLDRLQVHIPEQLNEDQRSAILHTLTHQLALVWGGPGTGKTRTLVMTMLVDLLLRQRSGMTPVRMLITTLTYRALVEIVTRVAAVWTQIPDELRRELADHDRCAVTLLLGRGRAKPFEPLLTDGHYCGMPTAMLEDRDDFASVRGRLSTRSGAPIELIFGVARQAYTLGKGGGKAEDLEPDPVIGLFDRIWIDESSQLAVAQALPVLSLLDEDGAIGFFGDRLQMPPVQTVPPPHHAEYLVGSIHTYLYERIRRYDAHNHGATSDTEQFLRMNYRSCEPIVAFSRQIGYRDEFTAVFPDRRLAHIPLTTETRRWDATIVPWTPVYEAILNPERPCVAVTYDDGRNAQANTFEATLVVGTVLTHRASYLQQAATRGGDCDEEAFWTKVIGMVTPHRAQRAAVVSLLQRALRPEGVPADLIDDAVDTVERFQGGERDLILISFGLGDPDLIQHEEEFLFQKERINVAVTRAKTKVVLFVTRDLSDHLPEDPTIIEASKAIKNFVYQHARHEDPPVTVTAADRQLAVRVRYRSFVDSPVARLSPLLS